MIALLSYFTGIGFALVKLPAFIILSQHFDELYPLASGLFYASGSVGLMVCAPFTQLLLDAYGWRGTLLLLGGINFHYLVCCALFRPYSSNGYVNTPTITNLRIDDDAFLPPESDCEKYPAFGWRSEGVKKEKDETFAHLLGLSLFKNFSFVAVCLAMASFVTSLTGWTVYFIPHCLVKSLTPYEATFAASVAGFAFLIGHFIYIPFLKRDIISVRGAICLAGLTAGIVLFFDKFTSTFVGTAITNSIYTCGIGVYCLLDVHMKTVLDQDSLAKAFGWRTAVGGLFRTLPGFIIGEVLSCFNQYVFSNPEERLTV